jgi:hypothetical protein
MKKHRSLAVGLALALFSAGNLAQDAAPPTSSEPLERPRPFAVSEGANPRELLKIIRAELRKSGLRDLRVDNSNFAVDAKWFDDASEPEDYDRVIIWLARPADAQDKVEVFLLHGRYMKFFGHGTGAKRILVASGERPEKIEKLEQRLIDLVDPE